MLGRSATESDPALDLILSPLRKGEMQGLSLSNTGKFNQNLRKMICKKCFPWIGDLYKNQNYPMHSSGLLAWYMRVTFLVAIKPN